MPGTLPQELPPELRASCEWAPQPVGDLSTIRCRQMRLQWRSRSCNVMFDPTSCRNMSSSPESRGTPKLPCTKGIAPPGRRGRDCTTKAHLHSCLQVLRLLHSACRRSRQAEARAESWLVQACSSSQPISAEEKSAGGCEPWGFCGSGSVSACNPEVVSLVFERCQGLCLLRREEAPLESHGLAGPEVP